MAQNGSGAAEFHANFALGRVRKLDPRQRMLYLSMLKE